MWAVMTPFQYRAEFERRVREFHERFATDYTAYDELLDAMNAIETEMNRNGGANWSQGGYDEFLDTIREHLTADAKFSSEEVEKIEWALEEIAACGRELIEDGESGRAIEEPIDYLIGRTVDWCQRHE